MTHGGKRLGSGRKPGTRANKTKLKANHLKRVQQQISLPFWVVKQLKASESNISKYILKLILEKNPEWKSLK